MVRCLQVLWWHRAGHYPPDPWTCSSAWTSPSSTRWLLTVYEIGVSGGSSTPALLHLHRGERSVGSDSKQDFAGICIGQVLQSLPGVRLRRSTSSSGLIIRRTRPFYAGFVQKWRLPMLTLGFAVVVAETARPWTIVPRALAIGELELQSSRTRRGAMLLGTRTRVAGMLHGYIQVPLQGRELQVQGSDNPRRIDARRTSRRWMQMGGLNLVAGVRLQHNNRWLRHLRHRCR